ncbi:MAG: hypothetical protein ABJP02_08985 [Parasphingorhabdus sp.]
MSKMNITAEFVHVCEGLEGRSEAEQTKNVLVSYGIETLGFF